MTAFTPGTASLAASLRGPYAVRLSPAALQYLGEAEEARPCRSRRTRNLRHGMAAAASAVAGRSSVDTGRRSYPRPASSSALRKTPTLFFRILAARDGEFDECREPFFGLCSNVVSRSPYKLCSPTPLASSDPCHARALMASTGSLGSPARAVSPNFPD